MVIDEMPGWTSDKRGEVRFKVDMQPIKNPRPAGMRPAAGGASTRFTAPPRADSIRKGESGMHGSMKRREELGPAPVCTPWLSGPLAKQ